MELMKINEACLENNETRNLLDFSSNSQESMPISFSKCESFKEIDFLAKTEDNFNSIKTLPWDSDIIFSSKMNSRQFQIMKNNFNTLFKISYPEDFFQKIQNHQYKTIIGFNKCFDVICFAIINIDNRHKQADILSLGVLKEFQGKKFGSRLLQKVLEELRIMAIKEISLIVQKTNTVAINLYKKLGFDIFKEEPNYYFVFEGENRKAFIMKKLNIQEQFWIFKIFKNIAKKFIF